MIKIIDDEGFKAEMKTYNISDTQLETLFHCAQSEFANTSNRIFHEILKENVPEIEVRLCLNEDCRNPKLGMFCTTLSDDEHLVFQILSNSF